jgi:hypothetical protein
VSLSPGGSYLLSKWTIEKAEFYGRVLEEGEIYRLHGKREYRKAGWLIICNKMLCISFQNAAIDAEF